MTRLCSDDEAVELANVVDFGLGGAVWVPAVSWYPS
jgi:acyl-CoA reductase-like NAD-dependent aldehyde dehydrogenase